MGVMSDQDPRNWMWSEALQMLARAQRLHREVFTPPHASGRGIAWEPPTDVIETAECWNIALASPDKPSVLALTRQNLPQLRHDGAMLSAKGAYRLVTAGAARKVVLLATGWLGGFFGLGLLGAIIAGGTLFLAASTARFADLAQYLLGLDGIALFGHDVGQGSRFRCDDFKHHFIGLDFNDQLVAFDAVTRLFVPRGHGAFGNGFRKGWRFDLSSHVVSLMCSLNPVGAYRLKASSTSWRCCSVWTDM